MSDIIQLLSFNFLQINIVQSPFEKSEGPHPASQDISYDVLTRQDAPDRMLMIMDLKGNCASDGNGPQALKYELTAAGEFKVPMNLTEEQKYKAVAFNGGLILYGLVRGQMAMVTGNFLAGSYLLPTVDWKETVEKTEAKRIESRKVASTSEDMPKRAAKKVAKRVKR